ncbi:hypothetical protein JCM16303_007106 [Sporobolomyces ruberrimus]
MDATGLCEKEKAAAGFPDIEDDDEVEQIIQGVDERARTPAMQAFLTAMSNRDDEDEHYDSLISLQTGLQEFQRPPCLVRKSEYDRCINSLKRIYRKLEKPLKDHRVSPFPFGAEWDLVCRCFYDYCALAVEGEIVRLDHFFSKQVENAATEKEKNEWEDERNAWSAPNPSENEVLWRYLRAQRDRTGLEHRREFLRVLQEADHVVGEATSLEVCRPRLDELMKRMKEVVKQIETHGRHVESTPHQFTVNAASSASLAHVPVSRHLALRNRESPSQ